MNRPGKRKSFKQEWLDRFGLPERGWRQALRTTLAHRAFISDDDIALLNALFDEVPKILGKRRSQTVRDLADGYGWFCHAFWQGESAFVAFPQNYAHYLLALLRDPEQSLDNCSLTLARLFRPNSPTSAKAGFNALRLADPPSVQAAEAILGTGNYEQFVTPQGIQKYAEYENLLQASDAFREDLDWMRKTFPRQMVRKELRRTLLPERNWVQGRGADFTSASGRFQALFDLFCWKYFLYGMSEGRPLLQKLSVNLTPYGTQIFIPGYLSLDPKRDIDFGAINRLHKARGVKQQGEALAETRKGIQSTSAKAKALYEQGRKKGYKGAALFDQIRSGLRRPNLDDRQIRRWLKVEAKSLRPAKLPSHMAR